jgi:hypothetical protein
VSLSRVEHRGGAPPEPAIRLAPHPFPLQVCPDSRQSSRAALLLAWPAPSQPARRIRLGFTSSRDRWRAGESRQGERGSPPPPPLRGLGNNAAGDLRIPGELRRGARAVRLPSLQARPAPFPSPSSSLRPWCAAPSDARRRQACPDSEDLARCGPVQGRRLTEEPSVSPSDS